MCFLKYFAFAILIAICFHCAASTEHSFDKLKKCLLETEFDVATYPDTIQGPFFVKLPPVKIAHIYNRSDVPFHVYNQLNFQWNSVNGEIKPMAYLWPTSVEEIRQTVLCCMKLNIPMVAKSGGHSYTKSSFGNENSLVVDLTRLNQIKIDKKEMTVEIGAGARLGLINERLAHYEFVLPIASCPTVGIGGFTLGGGYGPFSRKFGLAIDNLVEMELIDAKGRQLKVNNESYTQMWWALRGAGANAFGIVTKFKFRIHPGPRSVVYGRYEYNLSEFRTLFLSWQMVVIWLNNNRFFNFGSSIVLKNRKILFEIYYFNYPNSRKTVFKYDLDGFLEGFMFPKTDTGKAAIEELTYVQFLLKTSQSYFKEPLNSVYQLNVTRHNEVGWTKVKSFYVGEIPIRLNIDAITKLVDAHADHLNIAFVQNGGAIDKFKRNDMAFVHRNHRYDVQLSIFSPDSSDLKKLDLMDRSMKDFYDRTKPNNVFGHKESYQNYLDGDDPMALGRYYQENLQRLILLKKEWDPNNIFYHPQGIPRDLEALDKFVVGPEAFYNEYKK